MAPSSGGLGFLGTIRRLGGAIGLARSFRGLPRWQRRLLVVVAILALAAVLWLATGEWIWAALVVGVALLVLFVWLLIGWAARRVARARGREWEAAEDADRAAHLDEGDRNWQRIRQQLRQRGIDQVREPLYMLIGEAGAGKTTSLRRAGLQFPLGDDPLRGYGGTRMVDCFQTDEAAILDTAGRYSVAGAGVGEDGGADATASDRLQWESFLDNLRHFRPQAPINGVIVVLPATSLLEDDAETRAAKAHSLLRALNDLRERLEIRFPVTVMVSKSDRIGGFGEFFEGRDAARDPDFDRQLFGVGAPGDREWSRPFDAVAFRRDFDELVSRLRRRRLRLAVGIAAPQPRGRLFSFPEEFAAIASPLLEVLSVLFPQSEMAPPHFFRGVFFTSSMRREASLFAACSQRMPWPVEAPPPDHEDLHTRFSHDFYAKKVFRERGLLKATVARELWALLVNRLGAGAVAMLLLAGLAWVGWSGWKDIKESRDLARAVNAAMEFRGDQRSAETLNQLAKEIESLREPRGLSRPLDLIGRGARGDLADSLERLWRRRAFGDLLIVDGKLVETLGVASHHFGRIEDRERWRKAMRGIARLSLDPPRAPAADELGAMIALTGLRAGQAVLWPDTRELGVSVIDTDTIANLEKAIRQWNVDAVFSMNKVESSWPWVEAADSKMQAWECVRYLRLVKDGPTSDDDFCTWVAGVQAPSRKCDDAIPSVDGAIDDNKKSRESVVTTAKLGWPESGGQPDLVKNVETHLARLAGDRLRNSWSDANQLRANPQQWLPAEPEPAEIDSLRRLCSDNWKADSERIIKSLASNPLAPRAIESWIDRNLKERETGTSGDEQADPFTDMYLSDVLAVVAAVSGVKGVNSERLGKLDVAAATFVQRQTKSVGALRDRYKEATDAVNALGADGNLMKALKNALNLSESDGQTSLPVLMSPVSVLLPVPIPGIANAKGTLGASQTLETSLGGDRGTGPSEEWKTLKPVIEAVGSDTWSQGLWRTEPNANTPSSVSDSPIIVNLFHKKSASNYNSDTLADRMAAFQRALRDWFVKREAVLFGKAAREVAKGLPNVFPFVEAGAGAADLVLDKTASASITELLAWHKRASEAVCGTGESSNDACWRKELDGKVSNFITELEKWQPWLGGNPSVKSLELRLTERSGKVIEIVTERDARTVQRPTDEEGKWVSAAADNVGTWDRAGLRSVKKDESGGGSPGRLLTVGGRELFFTGPLAILELAAAVNGKEVTWPDAPGGTVKVTITVKGADRKDAPIATLPLKTLLNSSGGSGR
jgi:hypothetical protein